MIVHIHKCRPKNHPFPILAWLIMIFQGKLPVDPTAFSHIAISFYSLTGNLMYLDSTSKGVRIQSEFHFKKQYIVVESETLVKEGVPRLQFESWVQGFLGLPYDKSQIVGLALKILGFCTYNKLGKNYKAMTCNELALAIIEKFFNRRIGDSDNYDLNETWEIVKELA